MIRLFVGFDPREAVAYHTFCQSVLEKASQPVSFTPLVLKALPGYTETHTDGSNTFIYSRFLTPHLCNFEGWALFADGDMICRDDITKLWALRDPSKALMVVQHDYQTKAAVKYLGNKNQNYPRKNWSSVMLWNCAHPKHRVLTPEFLMAQIGCLSASLHLARRRRDRFAAKRVELADDRIPRQLRRQAAALHAGHAVLRGVLECRHGRRVARAPCARRSRHACVKRRAALAAQRREYAGERGVLAAHRG